MIDRTATVGELAEYLGLTERRIQQLSKEGVVLKDKRGEYKWNASVQGYIKYLQASLDGKESERGPKYDEEVKALKRTNEIAEGVVERLENIEAVYQPVMKRINQVIDRLPDIATEACPAIDGRGREKMAAALIVEKNELARAHEQLFTEGD